jgi:hypothetical protein
MTGRSFRQVAWAPLGGADNGVVDLRSQTGRSGATETRHLKAVTRDSSFDGPERQAPHDMLLDEEGQD